MFSVAASAPKGQAAFWKLTGSASAPYKNDRLAEYQQMLIDRGITDKQELRLLVAQLFQENGAVSEDRIGDHGCSFGLIQYNACAHGSSSARAFLKKNPEWASYKFQLTFMADAVKERYTKYNGNMKQVIVHHNRPASAVKNRDTAAGYFATISRKASLFSL